MVHMSKFEKLLINNPVRAFFQRVGPTNFFGKHSRLPKSPFCLEIGCGQGAAINIIRKKFNAKKIIALDSDPQQVELARNKLGLAYRVEYSLFVGTASALSFTPAKFDAVFDYGVLHHVPGWKHALAEIYRVLRPHGYFFYEDIQKALLSGYLFSKLFPHPPQGYFTKRQFENVLKQVGFNICWSRQWSNCYLLGVAQKP